MHPLFDEAPTLYEAYSRADPLAFDPVGRGVLRRHLDHVGLDLFDGDRAGWRVWVPWDDRYVAWVLVPVRDAGETVAVHGVLVDGPLRSALGGPISRPCPSRATVCGGPGSGPSEWHVPTEFERGLFDADVVFVTDNPFSALVLRRAGLSACSFADPSGTLGSTDGLHTLVELGLLPAQPRRSGALVLVDSEAGLDGAGASRLRSFFREVVEAPGLTVDRLRWEVALPPLAVYGDPRGVGDHLLGVARREGTRREERPCPLPPRSRPATADKGVTFVEMSEIANRPGPVVDWVVPGLAAAGAITDVIGQPKGGKSTYILGGVAAATVGGLFLSRPCAQSHVVYVTEERDHIFRSTLAEVGWDGRGATLLTADVHAPLPFDEKVAAVHREVERTGARIAAFDTLPRIAGLGDELNSRGAVLKVMDELRTLSDRGVAVLASRHSNKDATVAGIADLVRSGAGSQAYAGEVDLVVGYSFADGGSNRRSVVSMGRLGTYEEFVVERRDRTFVVVSGEDGGTPAAHGPNRAKPSRAEQKGAAVLGVLDAADGDPLTVTEIVERCADAPGPSPKRGAVYRALERLTEGGRVERVDDQPGGPHLYVRVASPSEPLAGSDEK